MARVTRSKKVDIPIAEDNTASIQNNCDVTIQASHLTEISNTNTMQDPIAQELKGLKAAYRTAIGATKKGGKRSKKPKKNNQIENLDRNEEQQALELSTAPTCEEMPQHQNLEDECPKLAQDSIEIAPPSGRATRGRAAKALADQELLKSSIGNTQTISTATDALDGGKGAPETGSKVIENAHALVSSTMPVTNTLSRSPIKTLAEVEEEFAEDTSPRGVTEDDSFVEQITARSPAKHVSRIEDSVEALDDLEEALDALDQATFAERLISPEKTRQKGHPQQHHFTTPLDSKALRDRSRDAKLEARPQTSKKLTPKVGAATMRIKSTAPRVSVIKKASSMIFEPPLSHEPKCTRNGTEVQVVAGTRVNKRPLSMFVKSGTTDEQTLGEPAKKVPVRRPISLLPPKEMVKSTKPATKATFELPGEAVARRLKEQKEARLAQRESSEDSFHTARAVSGPRIKSSKPLTKSTFELPGEAVSRRKREAHEARLRAQEEEERKRREFKAKPLRKSTVPNVVPRETVASRARQSRIGLENVFDGADGYTTLKRGSTIGPDTHPSKGANVGAHRPSLSQLSTANTSAPRAPGPGATLTRKPSTTTASGISMSGRAMQRTVSATEVQVQRQRAKEIYNRDAKAAEDTERERREREAAAKRAREEAAERGRQASRDWAEKQMAKKLAEADKGMSVGFGPGGQMGLKG